MVGVVVVNIVVVTPLELEGTADVEVPVDVEDNRVVLTGFKGTEDIPPLAVTGAATLFVLVCTLLETGWVFTVVPVFTVGVVEVVPLFIGCLFASMTLFTAAWKLLRGVGGLGFTIG